MSSALNLGVYNLRTQNSTVLPAAALNEKHLLNLVAEAIDDIDADAAMFRSGERARDGRVQLRRRRLVDLGFVLSAKPATGTTPPLSEIVSRAVRASPRPCLAIDTEKRIQCYHNPALSDTGNSKMGRAAQ